MLVKQMNAFIFCYLTKGGNKKFYTKKNPQISDYSFSAFLFFPFLTFTWGNTVTLATGFKCSVTQLFLAPSSSPAGEHLHWRDPSRKGLFHHSHSVNTSSQCFAYRTMCWHVNRTHDGLVVNMVGIVSKDIPVKVKYKKTSSTWD